MSKRLVIVESPTKAKTITRILGDAYTVISSFGHIRDLPKSKMGVDIEKDYAPTYVIPPDKRERVRGIKEAAKDATDIYLATDDDREGEAISWHLAHILGIDAAAAKRIVFHEITKGAIEKAVANPRPLNQHLVDAQQARRVLDRLVGYELSPFLWKKIARGLSAGRVQSVAVRLIVERERERQAFVPVEYWSLPATFSTNNARFEARLDQYKGRKINKMDVTNGKEAESMRQELAAATYTVGSVDETSASRQPKPPYRTSTLQQDANTKLGMSSKLTMRVAQQLYEGVALGGEGMTGLITYMRTDSTALAESFLDAARNQITERFGANFVSPTKRVFASTSKNAQEAHEAIRPTDPARTPESMRSYLDDRQFKLYDLVWRRAVATQMADAQLKKGVIVLTSPVGSYKATGSVIVFPGYLALYPDTTKEVLLPELTAGQDIDLVSIEAKQHFTEPPARYSDATLVKALEEHGIGRPSTYAPTISTVVDRGYVERDEQKRLTPTEIAFTVNDVLVAHFPEIVDLDFTANMERELDEIEEGKHTWHHIIDHFYKAFHKNLEIKTEEVSKKELTEQATDETCEHCGHPMIIKLGRFGKFMACSNYPECKHTIPLDRDGNKTVAAEPTVLGNDADGLPISVRTGRFGPYIQVGEETVVDGKKQKPKRASLLRGMKPEDVTLTVAQQLLSLPRTLGTWNGQDVTAHVGRFGPYVKAGEESRSIRATSGLSVLNITLEQAIELLQTPKVSRRRKTTTPAT